MCAPGAPQRCGSGPALLHIFSQMMCACWNQDVCVLSAEITNASASNCVLHTLSRIFFFYEYSWSSFNVAEFCISKTLVATE